MAVPRINLEVTESFLSVAEECSSRCPTPTCDLPKFPPNHIKSIKNKNNKGMVEDDGDCIDDEFPENWVPPNFAPYWELLYISKEEEHALNSLPNPFTKYLANHISPSLSPKSLLSQPITSNGSNINSDEGNMGEVSEDSLLESSEVSVNPKSPYASQQRSLIRRKTSKFLQLIITEIDTFTVEKGEQLQPPRERKRMFSISLPQTDAAQITSSLIQNEGGECLGILPTLQENAELIHQGEEEKEKNDQRNCRKNSKDSRRKSTKESKEIEETKETNNREEEDIYELTEIQEIDLMEMRRLLLPDEEDFEDQVRTLFKETLYWKLPKSARRVCWPRHRKSSQKLLVLDLDMTLICKKSKYELGCEYSTSKQFTYMVRPHVRTFVQEIANLYEIIIYSSGGHNYVYDIIASIPELKKNVAFVLHSENCFKHQDTKIKTLEIIEKRNKKDIIIIDDILACWPKDIDNLILVPPYFGGIEDTHFESLLIILQYLAGCPDMTSELPKLFALRESIKKSARKLRLLKRPSIRNKKHHT